MNNFIKVLSLLLIVIFIIKFKDIYYYTEVTLSSFDNVFVDINNKVFKKKQNILILSTDDRVDLEYLTYHKRSLTDYSKKHGYTFLFEKPCTNLPVYFCKFQRILNLMNSSNFDYYIWIDSDTIVNKKFVDYPLENMLETVGLDTDLITGNFSSIPGILKFLIGSFYVFKNNIQTKKLLQRCIDYIDWSKWENLKEGKCNYGGYCYEEAALFYSIKNANKNDKIKHRRLLGNFISNNPWCAPDYFIMHILGKKDINKCYKENS